MEIELKTFGKIAEFLPNQRMDVGDVYDTDSLKSYLENSYPKLAGMKYKLAVNKNIIQDNETLSEQDSVAIMPPFSGG